jgi:hypothetical protein
MVKAIAGAHSIPVEVAVMANDVLHYGRLRHRKKPKDKRILGRLLFILFCIVLFLEAVLFFPDYTTSSPTPARILMGKSEPVGKSVTCQV